MFKRMGDFMASVSTAASNLSLDRLRDDAPPVAATFAELNLSRVSPRMVAMGFPMPSDSAKAKATKMKSRNPAALVCRYLCDTFGEGRTLIVNLSEVQSDFYPTDELSEAGPVMEFSFPGYPSAPLGVCVTISRAIEAWLSADSDHAVAVHCMTGRGRTAVVCATTLAWMARRSPYPPHNSLPQPLSSSINRSTSSDRTAHPACIPLEAVARPLDALSIVCDTRLSTVASLTQPSQRRACVDFGAVLDGVRPHGRVLVLERMVLSGALPGDVLPSTTAAVAGAGTGGAGTGGAGAGGLGNGDGTAGGTGAGGDSAGMMVVEVFKGGALLWSSERHRAVSPRLLTAAVRREASDKSSADKSGVGDGFAFPETVTRSDSGSSDGVTMAGDAARVAIGLPLRGDVVIRCRAVMRDTRRSKTLFRMALHIGYVADSVLRLGKAGLDVACNDDTWPTECVVELIFGTASPSITTMAAECHPTGQYAGTASASASPHSTSSSSSSSSPSSGVLVLKKALEAEEEAFWDSVSSRTLESVGRDESDGEDVDAGGVGSGSCSTSVAMIAIGPHDTVDGHGGRDTTSSSRRFDIGDDDADDDDDAVSAGKLDSATDQTVEPASVPDSTPDAPATSVADSTADAPATSAPDSTPDAPATSAPDSDGNVSDLDTLEQELAELGVDGGASADAGMRASAVSSVGMDDLSEFESFLSEMED